MPPVMHEAVIALGANLGQREQTINAAIEILRAHPQVHCLQSSRLYRTKPVAANGPDFCNSAARFQTTLAPEKLLEFLLEIEMQLGRVRSYRNAPRTLDLDLIAFDSQVLALLNLTLPHPRAHERAFVLVPLCEIDDAVLLGPDASGRFKPAAVWLSQLDAERLQEVLPW
jgi:2-amino-4-hydroxy-6-hydroxymethyldihydropteridine diphosphokinase